MSTNPDLEVAEVLDREAAHLSGEFVGIYDPATVKRYVYLAYELLPDPKVRMYLPVFARRFARDMLRSAARRQGRTRMEKPQILFVCVHNAGRSQMAAAFARHLGGDRVEVLSAGSAPASSIHPVVHEAMKEVGIDLAEEFPKLLSDDFVRASDVVITMGCGDACPVYTGKRYEDWTLEDPAGQGLAKVREVRDAIRQRVQGLLLELKVIGQGPGGSGPASS